MKKLLAGIVTIAAASAAQSVELSTGIWMQSTGGKIGDPAGDNININGLKDSNDVYLSVDVNMPLIIPDLKFRSQGLTASGTVDFATNVTFGGKTFAATGTQNADLDLTYTDLVLNYGLPIPIATLDFGLNFRLINGSFTSAGQTADISLPLPMLHLAAGMPTPLGVSVYGEYNFLPINGANFSDIMVKAKYNLPLPMLIMDVGVEAGYHQFNMGVSGDFSTKYQSDLETSGIFVGLAAEF